MSRRSFRFCLGFGLLIAVACAASTSAQDSFKVVVHPSNSVTTIKKDELIRIFLRSTTKWNDGQEIRPVDQSVVSPTREAFSRQVLAMSVGKVIGFWQQQAYSGRAVPPSVASTETEVLRLVGSTPGAVGYVSVAADTGNLRVVRIE